MNQFLGMKLYGKTLKFRRGVMMNISILYACNLSCVYCALDLPAGGSRAKAKQSTLEEWKYFFEYFPVKIREVLVEGGEPTLVPWLPDLLNWLLHVKGYHVTVFSNLRTITPFLEVKNSHRFQITSTYHKSDDLIRFMAVYSELSREGYRVNVDEINTGERDWKPSIEFSRVKDVQGPKELLEQTYRHRKHQHFNFAPDQSFHLGCFQEFYDKGIGTQDRPEGWRSRVTMPNILDKGDK